MSDTIINVLTYAPIPIGATLLGGVIAAVRTPSARVRSMVQHIAAGVVFAATAGELLPELMHARQPVATVFGFVLGVALMLGIKQLTHHEEAEGGEHGDEAVPRSATALLAAVGIDITIDGILVGIGFAVGATQGLLLTIALTLEVGFLAVATAAELGKRGAPAKRQIAITAMLAALLAVGALIGALLSATLTGAPLVGVLGFGAAALLYLVTEELLVEAHEVPETPLTTAAFFLGFIVLFVIEMVAT